LTREFFKAKFSNRLFELCRAGDKPFKLREYSALRKYAEQAAECYFDELMRDGLICGESPSDCADEDFKFWL
jgi:hypothetical protein